MTTRAVEQVDDWDSRPFSGGYRGLHDLADDDFSGIVAAGPTRLCMTSGRVIGILDGTIEDFEDAEGTAHEAPSPALPLLSVMQERSDEVRAQYYTEETSIEEVDRTLTQGNFTGYVELSENVLSGDYYLVYHQGRSMSVAWVGASDKLLTDDEAFDQANGEVGIYEVRPVDIEVIEIPEPATPATGGTTSEPDAAAATTPDDDTESETASTEPADDGPTEPDTATESSTADEDTSEVETAETETAADDTAETEPSEPAADDSGSPRARAETDAEAEPDTTERSASESTPESTETRERGGDDAATGGTAGAAARDERTRDTERTRDDPERQSSSSPRQERQRSDSTGSDHQREPADRGASSRSGETQSRQQRPNTQEPTPRDTHGDAGSRSGGSAGGTGGASGPRSGTADSTRGRQTQQQSSASDVGGLETRSIPSLDPDRTSEPDDGNGQQGPTPSGPAAASESGTRSEPEPEPAGTPDDEPRREQRPASREADSARRQETSQREPERAQPERPTAENRRAEPRRESADAEPEPEGATPAEIEELEDELQAREAEIDDLEATLETVEDERDELAAERDELRERVEQLERRIDELRTEEGGESVADRERLSPAEAIEGTNLFVRYASKGDATLEAAHAGNAEAGAVNDNMQIQYHTQFEAEDVAVSGEPFTAYLTDTIQYSFVEWLVRVLPYEIRDTGHQEALGPLYDALPKIDRAELNGAITVQYQEDGEEHRSQESFDVVLRDRMGNPLIVANMNESRQPASQSMMEGLIAASQRVGESKESLAGAFLVTSSFFEPEAMEAAADATGSGLLSRDKRESFVKLSRKDGFHLCLVEAREENFNLSVPEI